MPIEIAGGSLVSSAIPKEAKRPNKEKNFIIDLSHCEANSVLVLITPAGMTIPCDENEFSLCVRMAEESPDRLYVVRVQRSETRKEDQEYEMNDREIYHQSQRTATIMDLTSGNLSPRSFVGKGARLSVDSCSDKEVNLRYSFGQQISGYTRASVCGHICLLAIWNRLIEIR